MQQARFQDAMKLVGSEFLERVHFYSDSWWPARELVINALNKRHEVFLFDLGPVNDKLGSQINSRFGL